MITDNHSRSANAAVAEFKASNWSAVYTDLFDSAESDSSTRVPQGTGTELEMQNVQQIPLLDFDLTGGALSLQGKTIKSATLELKMNRLGSAIMFMDISTITQEWDREATFYDAKKGQAEYPWWTNDPWAGKENGWFTGVHMSGGHSRYWRKPVSYDETSQILTVDIPTEVIYAMLNGTSCGFALIDAVTKDGYEATDRFKGRPMKAIDVSEILPKLRVNYCDAPIQIDMPKLSGLSALPLDPEDSVYGPSVKLSWNQSGSFSPDMRYYIEYQDDHEIAKVIQAPAYQTPYMKNGVISTLIYGLDESTNYIFSVSVTNGHGSKSAPLTATASTPDFSFAPIPISRDSVKNYENNAYSKDVFEVPGSFSVSVTDSATKISPVSGDPRLAAGNAYSMSNENSTYALDGITVIEDWAWKKGLYVEREDGWAGVLLKVLRGERTTFQLPVKRMDRFTHSHPKAEFAVSVKGDLAGAVQVSQTWARGAAPDASGNSNGANFFSDYCIPLEHSEGKFNIPFELNGESNPLGAGDQLMLQTTMPLFVDVYIRKDIPAGEYSFSITIERDSGESVVVPVEVEVADYILPNRTFNLEYNNYSHRAHSAGLHDNPMVTTNLLNTPEGYSYLESVHEAYAQLSFETGGMFNYVPYNHDGFAYSMNRPKIAYGNDGLPYVTDWSEWDAHYCKIATGAYVEDIAGEKVAATGIYLPISEDWPMSIYDYHSYDYTFWKFYDSVIYSRYQGDEAAFLEDYRSGKFADMNIPQLNAPLPHDKYTAGLSCDEQRTWRPLDKNGNPLEYNGYVHEAFFEGYAEGIKKIVKEFARHIEYNIENNGWSKDTNYQVFFNDKQNFKDSGWNGAGIGGRGREENMKWSGLWDWENNKPAVDPLWLARHSQPGTSWWQLDEPQRRVEWEALGFICGLIMEAKKELNLEKPGLGDIIKMRTDISRSYTQYDSMDGKQDIPVYNKTFLDPYKNENNGQGWGGPGLKFAQQRKLDFGEEWWVYDGWAGANISYSNNTNRILSVYAFGGNGYLSYEYFASHRSNGLNYGYNNPNDREASFVWGRKLGISAPLASFGMKVAGQTSELTRYLDALKVENGYTRRQIEQYIAAFINIHSKDTAQTVKFTDGSVAAYIPDSYMEPLKRDILEKLSAKTQTTSSGFGSASRSTVLSGISVSIGNGKLAVEFSPAVRNYTVKVSRDVDSIIIAATPKYPDVTVSGDGKAVLDIGSNVIEIVVASADGKTKLSYFIDAIRE